MSKSEKQPSVAQTPPETVINNVQLVEMLGIEVSDVDAACAEIRDAGLPFEERDGQFFYNPKDVIDFRG